MHLATAHLVKSNVQIPQRQYREEEADRKFCDMHGSTHGNHCMRGEYYDYRRVPPGWTTLNARM